MNPQRTHRFGLSDWLAYGLLAAALVAVAGPPADADDRDLLRTSSGEPAVFFLIDTSASMALKLGADPDWSVGWADGPDSRLYQAKQAIHNVFKDADDVDIAIATYNQDSARVVAKHWVYYTAVHPDTLNAAWPLDFPRPDADDPADPNDTPLTTLIQTPCDSDNDGDIDGDDDVGLCPFDTRVSDLDNNGDGVQDADVLTLGPAYLDGTGTPITTAGTCATPLDLGTELGRNRAQSFAISGTPGSRSILWLREAAITFRVEAWTTTSPGTTALDVHLNARQVGPGGCADLGPETPVTLSMSLDPHLGQALVVDPVLEDHLNDNRNCGNFECRAGLWDWTDVVSDWDPDTKKPFSGEGWEGNYDSGDTTGNPAIDVLVADEDRFCSNPANCVETVKPIEPTSYSSVARALDSGDMVPYPFTGSGSNVGVILNRVGPTSPVASPDFRGAPFYVADGNADLNRALNLAISDREPLLAADLSPLSNALLDFRCWFAGKDSSNKCPDTSPYTEGYFPIACENDSGLGCRAFYFIVISDGEVNGGQNNAGPSNLSDGGEFDGRMWVLNLAGTDDVCARPPLAPILNNTKSKDNCIVANDPSKLKEELGKILGEIREDIRAFASAAVPSVQATVQQKIFLTSFTPLSDDDIGTDDSAYWPGRVDAFLKPLPLTADGTPDRSRVCSSPSPEAGCFLWNADDQTETQVKPSDFLGENSDQRRVFYSMESDTGGWTAARRLFEMPGNGAADCTAGEAQCYDLWRGFGFLDDDVADGDADGDGTPDEMPDDDDVEANLITQTNNTVTRTLELKEADIDPTAGTTFTETYILADDFHSTPVVVGDPVNTFLFATDAATDGDPATDCDSTNLDPGYRCFFFKHQFRRNALLLGSDDGMLHAFDAGMYRAGTADDPLTGIDLEDEYDHGTGKELWSYIPRPLLPQVDALATGTRQLYGVDGTPVAADVFIDPQLDMGAPTPDDREWRTVVIGGFRDAGADLEAEGLPGGRGYYALDITQPDLLVEKQDPNNPSPSAKIKVPDPVGGFSKSQRMPSCLGDLDDSTAANSCGPLSYPAALWEFTDTVRVDTDPTSAADRPILDPLDEDGNGKADLGYTWSTPALGRILVCEAGGSVCNPSDPSLINSFDPYDDDNNGDLRVVNVAIFGGGMDTDIGKSGSQPERGDFLYMVDVETGQTIYKRRLLVTDGENVTGPSAGAAPSGPAAVDTNQDGFLDRIYIGTIGGYLFRVDLQDSRSTTALPALDDTDDLRSLQCDPAAPAATCPTQLRILDADANTVDPATWDPYVLFDTEFIVLDEDENEQTARLPIYFRPSVFFIAQRGRQWGLAFGGGDRENLFNFTGLPGRFFVLADTVEDPTDTELPLTEDDLQRIDKGQAQVAEDVTFLLDPLLPVQGWFLQLEPDERVITDPFLLSGVTVFSSFQPEIRFEGGEPTTVGCSDGSGGGGGGGGASEPPICSKIGTSNIFGVNTSNANGLLAESDAGGALELTRSVAVNAFVSNPFTEQSATQETADGGQGDTADALNERLTHIMETLKGLFPSNCSFANYRIDVKTIAADTTLQFIAPVPVCIIEKNWKEY